MASGKRRRNQAAACCPELQKNHRIVPQIRVHIRAAKKDHDLAVLSSLVEKMIPTNKMTAKIAKIMTGQQAS